MSGDTSRLLARGGRVFGLASLAHARGQRAGAGPWFALSPQLVSAAEQILVELEQNPDVEVLTAAVGAAMGPDPATAAPSWARSVWESSERLEAIGREVAPEEVEAALPPDPERRDLGERARGLAALAVALGRSIDAVEAVGRRLTGEDRQALVRMARLACVRVDPGQPTRVRAAIKRALGEGS